MKEILNKRKTGTYIKCKICPTVVYKTKRQFEKNKEHYCSRKCSCIDRNTERWSNYLNIHERSRCEICSKSRDYRSKHSLCRLCYTKMSREKNENKTIADIKAKYNLKSNGRWFSSEIRHFARWWNKDMLDIPCQKCSYNKHVELAHIKSISSFSDDTKLKIVNDRKNLLSLCPNCHWEFDEGLFDLSYLIK